MAREPKTLFGKLVKDFEGWGEPTLLAVREKVKAFGVPFECRAFYALSSPKCGCPLSYANGYDPSLPIKDAQDFTSAEKFSFSRSGEGYMGRYSPPRQFANKKSILFAIREALKNLRGKKAVVS